MKRYETVFDTDGTGHRAGHCDDTVPDCSSNSVSIPQSLFSNCNHSTHTYSDPVVPSHQTLKRIRTKRANSSCSQMNAHVLSIRTIPPSERKRSRRSLDAHGFESSPLYSFQEYPNPSPYKRNQDASFSPLSFSREQPLSMRVSRETSAASLASTSVSSVSTHQQDEVFQKREIWNVSSATNYQAQNTIERFLIHSVRDQFQPMVKDTRLCPNVDGLRTLRSQDVLPTFPSDLGVGTFSRVTRVILKGNRRQNETSYACKELKQELLSNVGDFVKAAAELAYEAYILSCFDHLNIIKLRGIAENGIASFGNAANQTQGINGPPANSFFLIMDVLQETLDQRIQRWKTTSKPQSLLGIRERTIEKMSLCKQLANVLEYIHSKGVVYRDLKPQNVGFCELEGGLLKLFDFGLARELPKSVGKTTTLSTDSNPNEHVLFELSGMVGTIRYMAPEVCLCQPYNRDCDIYSWSIVSWEVWSETKPFAAFTPDSYESLVCKQGYRPTNEKTLHSIPCDIEFLLKEAWRTEPHRRMRWPEITRRLGIFQNSEEMRLLDVAMSSRNRNVSTKNMPTFPSPIPKRQRTLDVAVNSPHSSSIWGQYERNFFESMKQNTMQQFQWPRESPCASMPADNSGPFI